MQKRVDFKIVKQKLLQYKRKYFASELMKGGLISLSALLAIFLIINYLEYILYLPPMVKSLLLFSFSALCLYSIVFKIVVPLYHIWLAPDRLSDEEAAQQIGKYIPEVSDRLLNIIQLQKTSQAENALIAASISQKSEQIGHINWSSGIDLKLNLKYVYYSLAILLLAIVVGVFSPSFYTDGTYRFVKYQTQFEKPMPFSMDTDKDAYEIFFNEDLNIKVTLSGREIPAEIFLILDNRQLKLNREDEFKYSYTLRNINAPFRFRLMAAGYYSRNYSVKVLRRPNLSNLVIDLKYPSYVGLEDKLQADQGNLNVPEGTTATWIIHTEDAKSALFLFDNEKKQDTLTIDKNKVSLEKTLLNSGKYEIKLSNDFGNNKESISYFINIKKDALPKIKSQVVYDSTYFDRVILAGQLSDDYGLKKLELIYQLVGEEEVNHQSIEIDPERKSQNFYYDWLINKDLLNSGKTIKYYLRVWDNDQINGSKFSTSETFYLKIPDSKEIDSEIEKSSQKIDDAIEKGSDRNKDLQKMIEEADFRIKSKRELNWQDKKLLQDIIDEKNKINQQLDELKEEFKENMDRRKQFQQPNEELRKKARQLEDLINSLQDEETKKLYQELQDLLREKERSDDFNQKMNEIKKQENNLNKDLERTKELFKRLQFELKMEKVIDDLAKTKEAQEKALEINKGDKESPDNPQKENKEDNQPMPADNAGDNENLNKQQQQIQKDFDNINKAIEDLEELNKELSKPNRMEDTDSEREDIRQLMEEMQQQMQQNNKPSPKQQQQAKDRMQDLQDKMQQMMGSMDMEMLNENIDDLRKILDNLLKLSFEQERLMEEFKAINDSDPRFITLSQRQLKLQDDSRVIEDSLQALATRVFQLQSFINKEITEMNGHMESAMHHLREREKNPAIGKQQFAMTSVNNLALLLDDVLDQMQDMMANAMGLPQAGSKGNQPQMDLSELQEQLNQQIQQLQGEQKSGRELSEQLMQLAEEQELLREMMKELAEKASGKESGEGFKDVLDMMEESENDIVNKRINKKLIERQELIKTRMLEAEKALKEQESDHERKGERASEYERKVPAAMQEYIKQREKEVELLRTVPPRLSPFYREEVEKYFERLRQDNTNK